MDYTGYPLGWQLAVCGEPDEIVATNDELLDLLESRLPIQRMMRRYSLDRSKLIKSLYYYRQHRSKAVTTWIVLAPITDEISSQVNGQLRKMAWELHQLDNRPDISVLAELRLASSFGKKYLVPRRERSACVTPRSR